MQLFYVAIAGGHWASGTFNQPTSNGTSVVSGLSFTPQALILTSVNNATATSGAAPCQHSWGVATGSTSQFTLFAGATDTTSPGRTNNSLDRTHVIDMYTPGATATLNAQADFTSFNSTGFTITWGTTDATAREVLYLAIGP